MSKKLYEESDVQAIADAIREKNGSSDTYKLSEMAAAVLAISSDADHTVEDAIITRTITEYSNDRVEFIGKYSFQNCASLTSVNFPAVKNSIDVSAFQNCTSLMSVSFPNVRLIAVNAFQNCTSLTSVNFSAVETMYAYSFRNCTSLTSVNFPAATKIDISTFLGCTSLNTLILSGESVCTLSDVNAFTNTPIESGTGYIYVPSALIDTYKTATNWVTFANQFRALEDYTVDGTTTGELDESKVNV